MNINKKIKLLNFSLKKDLWQLLFWSYKSIFSWNWIDFVEHREYVYWDPIKNIDWKTLSKSNKIYTKIFEEDRDLRVLFFIDLALINNKWFFSKSKKDILEEVFYWLCMACNESNDSIWIYFYDWINNNFISYKKWFTNIYKWLNIIETSKNITSNSISNWFQELADKNINNNLIFILTDEIISESQKSLKKLSIKNEIIYINIFDYFENNLHNVDWYMSLSNNKLFADISLKDKAKVKKFRELRYKKIKEFNNFLQWYWISYLYLDTKKDIFKEIYLFFSKLKK